MPQAYSEQAIPLIEQYDETSQPRGRSLTPSESRGRRSRSRSRERNQTAPTLPIFNLPSVTNIPTINSELLRPNSASLRSFLRLLIPSFLSRSADREKAPPPKIVSTTYLNGIRGLAASFVYVQHFATDYYKFIHVGYLASPGDTRFIQLPYIRLIFSGRFMVGIFFILSGFVLSHKPLQLIRTRNTPTLLDNLSSSVFRRGPRLFLPCILPIFVSEIPLYLGIWGDGDPLAGTWAQPTPSIPQQFMHAVDSVLNMLNPFTWEEYYPGTTPQLWTLPMEFRGSMVVFLLLLCFGKSRSSIRISAMLIFAWFCLHEGRWDTFLFVCGILCAEWQIIRKSPATAAMFQDLVPSAHARHTLRLAYTIFFLTLLTIALFFGSWPAFGAGASWGFSALAPLTPAPFSASETTQEYFWISLGAIMMMVSFEHLELLQKPFVTPLARYLGDISFAFYIVHWPVIFTLGRWITPPLIRATGSYGFGFTLGMIIVTPVVVWIADVHWRLCDEKSVKFARYLAGRCAMKD